MKYFLDTEFLEGGQTKRLFGFNIGKTKPTIDLISIGIVAEDGREYYAISKDFNLKEAWDRYDLKYQIVDSGRDKKYVKQYWIRENVLRPIYNELMNKEVDKVILHANYPIGCHYETPYKPQFCYKTFKYLINKYGKSNKDIAKESRDFIMETGIDYGAGLHQYAPIDIYTYYGDYDWVAFCWLFGRMIDLPTGFPMYSRDLKQMLDEKCEELLPHTAYQNTNQLIEFLKKNKNYPKQHNEHNALADAEWNKKFYEFLQSL